MSGPKDRLADLARIAALLAEAALPPVAAAQNRLAEAQSRFDAVAARRAALSPDAADDLVQAALLARQAGLLRIEQAGLGADLARARAELDVALAAAQRPLARKAVLDRLVKGKGRPT